MFLSRAIKKPKTGSTRSVTRWKSVAFATNYRAVQQAFQEANGFFQRHDYDSVQKYKTIAPRA
ncbi:hypothetical protein Tsubulata_016202 [Turnera subulata]|uniref:Uncharacterized protein n=1 Tax=Turnera subulata TaxID=218843 RepID=A0A9Q0G6W5_9ROSI|nr:hypothetical protein Tsubulata_016202 [Turnera subulata]